MRGFFATRSTYDDTTLDGGGGLPRAAGVLLDLAAAANWRRRSRPYYASLVKLSRAVTLAWSGKERAASEGEGDDAPFCPRVYRTADAASTLHHADNLSADAARARLREAEAQAKAPARNAEEADARLEVVRERLRKLRGD